jgi:hypothetical protein
MGHGIRVLTLLALLFTPAVGQAPDEWKTFRSEAAGFSVRVPGTPLEQTEMAKPVDKSAATHSFVLAYKDTAYILSYTDLAVVKAAPGYAASILDAARDGGIKNVKGKLVTEQHITVNGYPGRDIVAAVPLDDKKGIAHFRIVLAKSRLYMALYVGPFDNAGGTPVDRFLKSFQILTGEPQDGWKTFTSVPGKFTIRVPNTPKEDVSDLSGGGKIHVFTVDKGDYAYILSYSPIAGGSPKPEAVPAILNNGRDAMLSSLHGKLIEEKPIELAGNSGKSIRIALPDKAGTAYVRGYISGDQYYQVMLLGTNKTLETANADRYFASFQLVTPQIAIEWKSFTSKEGRFTIDLPGEPKPEKLPDNTYKFAVEIENTVYIVVYTDVADAITDPDKVTQVLEASKDAELKLLEGKSLTQKRIKAGEFSGIQINFSIPASKIAGSGYGIERFYLAGKRIYEVGVITDNIKAEEPSYARFFDSFKVAAP